VSLDWTALSDGELAALSSAGRQAAYAEIVRRHGKAVFRLVRSCVGDSDEALDLTQEAFIAAYRALSRYDVDRPMRTWLSTIALNKCRDWGRKRKVRRLFLFAGPIDEEAKSILDDQAAVDDATADREELARVERVIAELPPALKETLVLRTIEGLSQSATAAALSISEKAVETRLYRARTKLREKLDRV
jgi:RNA polymerase sigma factor (sigma-70 family)